MKASISTHFPEILLTLDMEDANEETNVTEGNIVFTSFTVVLYKKDTITKLLLC